MANNAFSSTSTAEPHVLISDDTLPSAILNHFLRAFKKTKKINIRFRRHRFLSATTTTRDKGHSPRAFFSNEGQLLQTRAPGKSSSLRLNQPRLLRPASEADKAFVDQSNKIKKKRHVEPYP